MTELGPDLAAEILAVAENNAAEASAALSRTFDVAIDMTPGTSGTLDFDSPPEGLDDPGLLLQFKLGDLAALAFISESSGQLPDWYAEPDATGTSKLQTLAQELGMLLLPESHLPGSTDARRVENLMEAIVRGGVSSGAGLISFELRSEEDKTGTMHLVWPATKPDEIFAAADGEEPSKTSGENAAAAEEADGETTPETSAPAGPDQSHHRNLQDLPQYSRSLLRISVPVVVSLAQQRQPIHRILEIGTGSILQFDKSCEELLELEVSGQRVAEGEAVKIGDKFGLRITSLLLPEERFRKESGPKSGK